MAKAEDLTGRHFGAWEVIGKSEKPGRVKCRCGRCGQIYDVRKDKLKEGVTKRCAACASREGHSRYPETIKALIGHHFGEWTVIGESENHNNAKCQCSCGNIRDIDLRALRNGTSTMCRSCAMTTRWAKTERKPAPPKAPPKPKPQSKPPVEKKKTEKVDTYLEEKRKEYVGQTVNGWKVVSVFRDRSNGTFNSLYYKAICPECGRVQTAHFVNLGRSAKCAYCRNAIMAQKAPQITGMINEKTNVDGSSLLAAKLRLDGKVNRNSTTGHNGVWKITGREKYKAMIYFKQQRIDLGNYDTIEEAAMARKVANEVIYGAYLSQHEGWEEELKEALEKLHEEQKKETK